MCKSEDSGLNSFKYVFVGVIDVEIGNRGDLFQKSTILEKIMLNYTFFNNNHISCSDFSLLWDKHYVADILCGFWNIMNRPPSF